MHNKIKNSNINIFTAWLISCYEWDHRMISFTVKKIGDHKMISFTVRERKNLCNQSEGMMCWMTLLFKNSIAVLESRFKAQKNRP